jgi:hypothetical protein
VSIAPGATINVSNGATITVHGTLTASDKASHAKLTGTWGGIVVAQGGTLSLTGVDLNGAGIHVNAGDKAAAYDYGTMTGGTFTVDKDGTFTTDHAAVVQGGASTVGGTFTATFMDYSGQSITLNDAAATVSVADSKITGAGTGTDFFTSEAGLLFHAEYSVVTNTHCPYHFDNLAKYTIDHVASRSNGYGPMLYNPDPGPNTISYSSFEDANFSQTDRTTTINIDHTYIKSKATVGIVNITTAASAPVTAAAPRGLPGPNG